VTFLGPSAASVALGPLQSRAMTLDETPARRILLAQAIEASGLLSDAEVDRVDDEASQLVQTEAKGDTGMGSVLASRADILLAIVQQRDSTLVTSLSSPLFSRGRGLVPLLALVLGFSADRIANPHRVDLLSAPILVLLAWNLAVYAVLFASMFRRPATASDSLLLTWRLQAQSWGRFLGRRTNASAAARASATFLRLWQSATSALNTQRLTTLMHWSAAAWAFGIVLSLLGRGLFVAYGVGWESTWLDAETLHFVLKALFTPLVMLLSLDPFTLDDIARLQVGTGAGGDLADGRRWALMYAGLLVLVVIIPRLLLGGLAAVRALGLSKNIQINLEDPYFQRIIDNLFPAQVRLAVITHRAGDRHALARVLQQVSEHLVRSEDHGATCLIDTSRGDGLWWDTPSTPPGSNGESKPAESQPRPDVVLHVVGHVQDLTKALPQLRSLGQPVLMLVRTHDEAGLANAHLAEQCRQHIRSHELAMEVLDFADFAYCWPLEDALLDAFARRVSRSRSRGMVRLQAAWMRRNLERFMASVQAMAEALLDAAREHEAIDRLTVVDRVQPSRVREHKATKAEAMKRVQGCVHAQFDRLLLNLLTLHQLDSTAASEMVFHAEKTAFEVSGSIGASEAAMGGAASGAAIGASVDLLTGGLTLGAAAALGALTGGSAALIGTLWSNRDTPDGRVRIGLSDDMLMALVQACVLRYLAVIHVYRDSGDLERAAEVERWKLVVLEHSMQRRKRLLLCMHTGGDSESGERDLVEELRQMTVGVLQSLYPGARGFLS
jgi:hypothetical protein